MLASLSSLSSALVSREERPLIYHLDVAAMYPNIILTNRCATARQAPPPGRAAACTTQSSGPTYSPKSFGPISRLLTP